MIDTYGSSRFHCQLCEKLILSWNHFENLKYLLHGVCVAVTMVVLICQHSTAVLSYSLTVYFDSSTPLAVFWLLACRRKRNWQKYVSNAFFSLLENWHICLKNSRPRQHERRPSCELIKSDVGNTQIFFFATVRVGWETQILTCISLALRLEAG